MDKHPLSAALRLEYWLIINYSVSQKNPPCGFLTFFPERLGIFNPFLHTY